jgi:hypothetical protein
MKQPISATFLTFLLGKITNNIELVDMTKENLYAIGVLILVMVSIWINLITVSC